MNEPLAESKTEKILFKWVSLTLSIGLTVYTFVGWITNPQTNLQIQITKLASQVETNKTVAEALNTIKNNDLHEIHLSLDRMEERDIEMLKTLAKLEALITKK